jgi:flagellar protein FliO/FliZ
MHNASLSAAEAVGGAVAARLNATAGADGVRGVVDAVSAANATAAQAVAGAANATGFGAGTGTPFDWSGYIQALGVLCLLLAALYGVLWAVRRFGAAGRGARVRPGDMKIEGHLALGPKRSVMVVRILNRRLVLGVTDHNINLLTELTEYHEHGGNSFAAVLDEAGDGT